MSKVYLLMATYENDESDEAYMHGTEVIGCYAKREDCLNSIDNLSMLELKHSKIFQNVILNVDYSYLDEKYTKDNCINPDSIIVEDLYPRKGSRIIKLLFNFFNKWERVEKIETVGYAEFWCFETDIIESITKGE